MKHFFLIFLLDIAASLSAQSYPDKIGVGLDGIGGIALEFPNLTHTAAGWQSVATGNSANIDSSGWPTEDFRVVFFDHRPTNAWNNAPDDPDKYVVDLSGLYTLSFKGQANLSSWSDAPIEFRNKNYNPAKNETTVELYFPPGGSKDSLLLGHYGFLMVNFLQTNFATGIKGVKEIRLLRPNYPHNSLQIFRTDYLNALSPFSSLRFMDFIKTNNANIAYPKKQSWTERQHPTNGIYTKGAPWETVIALANYTAKDIWINIPVDADSSYIAELALLMHKSLRPEIHIYLEYSNEVWNAGFTQYKYNYDAVLQSPEDADIRSSTPWDDRRRARRVAKQVIRIGQIFENIMGISVASQSRIRPIFAWQVGGYLTWYDDVLNWINATYGPPRNYLYGIASAPYFGEGNPMPNASPQQIVQTMSNNSDALLANIRTLAGYASQWKIKHLQYEGGPDNGGGSTVNIANRIRANRIPEMKTAVLHNYRDNWFSANAHGNAQPGTNDLIHYFVMSGNVSRYGCWGATEDLEHIKNLSRAPKYDALCQLTGRCGNEPRVSLTNPSNNDRVPVNAPLSISASASDPDGSIQKVEFFINATLIGTDSLPPYSVQWTPTQEGSVAVLAKAIDNDNKYTCTDAIRLEVIEKVTSIQSETKNVKFQTFPQPFKDILHVDLFTNDQSPKVLELRNALGELLRRQEINTTKIQLNDLQYLPAGLYALVLKTSYGRCSKIIMKAE